MNAPIPSLEAIIRAHVRLIANPDDVAARAHWCEVLAAELGRAKKVVTAVK